MGVPASFSLPLSRANILQMSSSSWTTLGPLNELLQNRLIAGRVGRVEHSLVKFCYGYNAYAYTFGRQLFKASNHTINAMQRVNDPVCIY